VQTVPAEEAEENEAAERIVVIGSLVPTTAEDAPKPVEVFTRQDLDELGAPTMDELLRTLTVNSPGTTAGEASPLLGATAAGFNTLNLRGLGANASLALFNGRRLATTNGGAGADVNTIPMAALSTVEVLREGATSQYGAGAVGGVVNFTTRRDVDAPEITLERTMYDGSEGAYKADFITGWVGDSGNLLLTLSYEHEAPMLATKRDFSSQPLQVNPSGWTTTDGTNPGLFRVLNSNYLTITGGLIPSNTVDIANVAGTTGAFLPGRVLDTIDPSADCAAFGGVLVSDIPNYAGNGFQQICAYSEAPFSELVADNDTYQFFGEWNAEIRPSMEIHLDSTYSKSETISRSEPSGPPQSRAISERDPGRPPLQFWGECGNSTAIGGDPIGCRFVIPTMMPYYTEAGAVAGSVRNPFIDDFMTRTGAVAPDQGGVFTTDEYTPFYFGGHPLFDYGLREATTQRERFMANVGVRGEFDGSGFFGRFLEGVSYDYNAQYNQYLQTIWGPRVIASRLHAALNGYGGEGCAAIDRVATNNTSPGAFMRSIGIQSDTVPGTEGCEWFNPFASSWETAWATGAPNPNFNPGDPVLAPNSTPRPEGYLNSRSLIDWMTADRRDETQYQSLTFDANLNGQIPESAFTLPGGQIGWAAGAQWRQIEQRDMAFDDDPDLETLHRQECPFPDPAVTRVTGDGAQVPGDLGCDTAIGAYYDIGQVGRNNFSDSQTLAFFGEVQLPVTDYLIFQLAARRESFNGGDVTGDTYNVAGKWDVTDDIFFRASYGTAFRAEEALDFEPGFVDSSVVSDTVISTTFEYLFKEIVAADLSPESDTTFNAGFGYEGDFLAGELRASVDFFENVIEDEVVTTTAGTVLIDVFDTLTGISDNCASTLTAFITWNTPSGMCELGVGPEAVAGVQQVTLNAAGFVANGYDYLIDYSQSALSGTLSLQLRATQNAIYKNKLAVYDDGANPPIVIEEAQSLLGQVNSGLALGAAPTPDWRANATVRWRNDSHNINLRANYVSGVFDERADSELGAAEDHPGTAMDVRSNYGRTPKDYIDYDLTYFYTPSFIAGFELRASVLNLTNEDPMPFQSDLGYLGIAGNPRGRRVEIGITKRF
jgi:outer membrane receptor protein involved in Fe transport